MRTLVWFRGKDLRVSDHAPLSSAVASGEVIPLFVLDPYFFAPERARRIPHRMQFLLASLRSLSQNLEHLGSRLLVVEGKSVDVVPALARRVRADRVVAHRWSEPFGRERDRRVNSALSIPFELFEGETLHAPGSLRTQQGAPFMVFTAFARAFAAQVEVAPLLPAPERLPALPADVTERSVPIPTLEALGIAHNPELVQGGERAAKARLRAFLDGPAARYHELRDRLDQPGTSRLSQDLKFGTLSVRTLWHAAARALATVPEARRSFENELVWREFTHATLWDHPAVLEEPLRPEWRGFPYREPSDEEWRAWTEGRTGYPIVDAAARQLRREGFVHNRARMIAASFLTKHLLVDYRRGEQHYLQFLTDGDWAQNNAGWQWTAGCGTDAQPYFRVFNPVLQGEKFDPTGAYVRRYVTELALLPERYLHRPWEMPPDKLAAFGVSLGRDYPLPIVDHTLARRRFLSVAESYLKRGR
jgi:deoxyribodipyrimidine photo-lyase